jgi:hypothetical protein
MKPGFLPFQLIDRWSYRGIVILVLGIAASFLTVGLAGRFPFPINDYLQWISDASELPFPAVLWAPYNSHRLIFTRLMVWADVVELRGGMSWLMALTNELVLVAVAALIIRNVRNYVPARDLFWYAVAIIFVLFRSMTLASYTNLMDLHFPLSVLFFLLGLELARIRRLVRQPLFLALLMSGIAVAASCTMSGGLVCWPLFALVHAAETRRRIGIAVIGCAAALFGFVYFIDFPLNLGAEQDGLLDDLVLLPIRLARYMGAAWAFGPIRLDLLGGFITIIAGCIATVEILSGRVPPASARGQGIYLVLFGLANGLLTSVGRHGAIGQRFALYGEVAQIGLVLMYQPQIDSFFARFGQARIVKLGALVLVLCAAGTLFHDGRQAMQDRTRLAELHARLVAGEIDQDTLMPIHPFSTVTAAAGIAALIHFRAYGFGAARASSPR